MIYLNRPRAVWFALGTLTNPSAWTPNFAVPCRNLAIQNQPQAYTRSLVDLGKIRTPTLKYPIKCCLFNPFHYKYPRFIPLQK
jgi:hypothetical protein